MTDLEIVELLRKAQEWLDAYYKDNPKENDDSKPTPD